MVNSSARVGFVSGGDLSPEQQSARDWLECQAVSVRVTTPGELDDSVDVAWWHRRKPLDSRAWESKVTSELERFVGAGGGLLLTMQAMCAVDQFSFERVGPDVVESDPVGEPTGLLWRSLYEEHPIVSGFESLRIPLCDVGPVPSVRYERAIPEGGEVLASTIRGDGNVPHRMSAVSWSPGSGSVLGIGAPVVFDAGLTHHVAENRNAFVSNAISALASGEGLPGRPKEAHELTGMRESLSADTTRPRYHFTPPANWLNDPNGLLEWNGRYHLFYQYNPAGPFHNTIHWGHAVSDDLVTWTDQPVALSPSPDGPDRDGCWSGCAIDDGGRPRILYTGGNGRTQLPCLATADDGRLCHWNKYEGNPIISEPPAELDIPETEHWEAEFRDHSVWREDGEWHQLIGTGIADVGGATLHYTSDDLLDWTYEGPLMIGEWAESGSVWECPELLTFDECRLLHVSNYEDVVYFVGTLEDGEFAADHKGILDHGDFYAPQSMWDGDRYLTWGWLPEARDLSAQWESGWSGALSLPRVVSVTDGREVQQRPAAEVETLRERQFSVRDSVALGSDERERLPISGRSLELQMDVRLEDASAFELSVFESPDRDERTPIRYTREGELIVDRSATSNDHRARTDAQRMHVPPYDEPLSLRVFLDGSVIEIYANQRHCLTSRVYPERDDSTAISVATRDGRAVVTSLSGWQLGTAFDNQVGEWVCSPRRP